jgi:hypothetical protein
MGRIGSSLVSVSALVWATHAFADTTLSGGSSTPVKTSTANNGQPDNLVIDSSGTLGPTSGVAVTLDSNNTVSNAGSIAIPNSSNSTGILALGGNTGSVTNSGAITLSEDATTTTDNDGVIHGPFANGENRFGIQVTGPATFDGPITNTGAITIIGNTSAAISVETNMTGTLSSTGIVSVTGTNTAGLRTTGSVGGDVSVMGSVSATGQGAQALSLGGNVGGGVIVQGALTSTGYRYTTAPTDTTTLADLAADDLLQGGPTVSIAGSVARGLLIDIPPVLDANNPDVDGDGIPDVDEGTGTVTSYGSAPAIRVGAAAGTNITLGNVGTGDSSFAIINKGSITGSGVYAGVSATGLQLGLAGGGTVDLSGGLKNTGSIVAAAFGDATAVEVEGGVTAQVINNYGIISSGSTTDSAVTARGVAIEAGANVPVLQNSGTIIAGVVGATGNATAIVDNSGTLSRIETTGSIIASVTTSATSTTLPTGKAVAIDASANTGGLYLWQYMGTGATTAPVTSGAVLLGSGADRLDVLAGTLTGDVSFGAGANVLNIDGGASVVGAVTADGGTLGLSVATGTLQINNTPHLNLTSLNLGAASQLMVTIDPASNAATELDVAGAANIASGAKIGVRLTSILQGSASYTLIQASQLNAGTIDSSLLGAVPYLYTGSLSEDAAAGTVSVNLALKSAADLQLPAAIASAYQPVLAAANRDPNLRTAVLSQTNRTGLLSAYNQLLPDHSGTIFQMASLATQEFAKPLDERQDVEGGGAWAQEINYGEVMSDQDGVPGYKAWGLGLVGGFEAPAVRLGVFGVTLAASSNSSSDDDRSTSQRLTSDILQLGGYWRVTDGPFSANAHVGGDYLKMTSDRVVSIVDSTGATLFGGTATGHWDGMGASARFRAAYEGHLGDFFVRPQAGLDYFALHENGYSEYGGDVLDLTVSGRASSELSAFAGVGLGAVFGDQDGSWGPELLLGYRDVVSENVADTTARFTAGGDSFTLAADQVGGQGGVVRLSLKGENGFGGVSIEGGAEVRDALTIYDLRLAAHFAF